MRHGTVDDKRVSHDLPVMVDQLDLLVGPVVGEAVVDEDVEPVPLAAHVDGESDGVAHVDRTVDAVAGETVAGADLHEALGRGEGEDNRVRRVGSAEQGGGTDMAAQQGGAKESKDGRNVGYILLLFSFSKVWPQVWPRLYRESFTITS